MEPLANRIRPDKLDDFIGQSHLTGEGRPLRLALQKKHLFSFILWGPPGSGKTTLARIYARSLNIKIYELSAVSAGKNDIRKILNDEVGGTVKVLFLDEIHRFNKAQQDFLLPFVESGKLFLIGATTENPSFEIIPPLLSRCQIFILQSLSAEDIKKIITRTKIKMDEKTKDWLVAASGGDARQTISLIENTQEIYGQITIEALKKTWSSKILRYDKKGEEHYNTISAFIKSLRASQPNAALYYLARMIKAGEDPKFIARRMIIFASEDIGMGQPTALVVANNVFRSVETVGLPECAINLAHGAVYLSECQKERAAYDAYLEAMADVEQYGNLPIPIELCNPTTKLMEEIGYGQGYEYYSKNDFRPEKLRGKIYYKKSKRK